MRRYLEIVALADTGLDTGDPVTIHPDFRDRIVELKRIPVRPGLLPFMADPGIIVEGPADNTWELCRILIGKTQVIDAQPGSIRGDFATTTNENLVHGSDGPESAEREIGLWFPGR
jgi:nucleoside diphosphate kinase